MKTCPACAMEFDRRKRIAAHLCCPYCETALFITQNREARLMIDKLTVDQCIALVNMALGASLGEATPRERKYLYDLIEILRQEHFEECQDVGLSVQELAYKLVEHWLADEYYGALIRTEKTILIIHNRRSRDAVTLLNELREEAAWIDDREYAEQEREQQVGLKISRLKERMFAIGT